MNTPVKAISTTVRRARPLDAMQIIAGINSVCAEEGAFYTTRYVSTPQWEAVLHHPESLLDHILLVAELDKKILGACRLFPGGQYTLLNHVGELGIFVLKPFRHRGIGTQLFAAVKNWAMQQGLEKISLAVFAGNQPAINFYRKHLFFEEGRLSRHIKMDGSYDDVLMMGFFLK